MSTEHQPPTGAHLAAILDGVESRVLDTIDRQERRRRSYRHWLVGGLIASTLVAGTAATAIVVTQPWLIEPGDTSYRLSCVEGDSITTYPFFSVDFTLVAPITSTVEVDPVEVCRSAWKSTAEGKVPQPPLPNQINSVGYGELNWGRYGDLIPEMAVCAQKSGESLFVLSADPEEPHISISDWSARCDRIGGFEYWKNQGTDR